MNHKHGYRCVVAVAGLVSLVLCGCQITSFQETDKGIYALERHFNTWQATIEASVTQVHEAIEEGLKDLEIKPITSNADDIAAVVQGMFADGMEFTVKATAIAPKQSRISIRCGMIGDKVRAEMLFRAIEKNL